MPCVIALFTALLLVPAAAPAAKPEPCPGGRYLVDGDPLVPGGAVAPDVVEVGTTAAIASGCEAVPVKLRGKKKGTKLKVRFPACEGLAGKARLVASIEPTCTTMTGTFRAKKAKLKRQFTATLDTNLPPEGSFTTASATIAAGSPLAFTATGSDPDGDPVTFSWRFGDGGMGGGEDIAHVFATTGSFDVVLTIADGRGGTDTAQQTIEVTPGPQPAGTVTAQGTVKTTAGTPLDGVLVTVVGGGDSGTTDATGTVTVDVPVGAPGTLRLTRSGYADQIVVVDATASAESALFRAEMIAREAPLELASAQAGGTLAGKHGATIIVPPASLVDASGTPVAGAVQVSMSPVDPTSAPDAFPGVFAGVTPAAEPGLLLSYGTVEYALSQGGQAVNLAPGAKATIEIPAYGDATKDGTPIAPGSTIPLWSLDERTGGWVQEGIGTIVASAASPTGLALRGEVTHFSWWNCDAFDAPPYKPKPRCLVDTDHDGNLEDLTDTGYCWHYGTGPDQPPFGAGGGAGGTPRLPQYAAETMLPPSGGVVLPVPADYDITLRSTAKGGTLAATTVLNGPADLEEDIDVVLEEVDPSSAVPISIPWDQVYTADAVTEVDQYVFTATAGAPVFITVSRSGGSLRGNLFVDGPGTLEYGPTTFANGAAEIGFLAPETGEYRIAVEATADAPGSYRLQVQPTGTFPLVLSMSPADGSTGQPLDSAIEVTFTTAIDPATITAFSFLVAGGGVELDGTRSVAGSVVTFTPAAPLAAGTPHTVTLRTQIRALAGGALPAQETLGFSTADVVGSPAFLGLGRTPDVEGLPGNEALALFHSYSPDEVRASHYAPGEGWSPPRTLSSADTDNGLALAANAAGETIAIWRQRDPVGGLTSVWGARRSASGVWEAGTAIETLAVSLSGFGLDGRDGIDVDIDGAGNALAVYSESNGQLYWSRYTAGVGWSAGETLSNLPVGNAVQYVDLDVNEAGEALCIWSEYRYGEAVYDAVVRRFTPAGGWGPPVPVDDAAGTPIDTSVAIDPDGNGMALWRQNGGYRARRYDAGDGEWSATSVPLQADSSGASLAADNMGAIALLTDGRAFAVAHAYTTGHLVWAAEYTPGAAGTEGTWAPPVILDTVWPSGGVGFGVNASGDGIAVWPGPPGSNETRYKRLAPGSGWDASVSFLAGFTDEDRQPYAAASPAGGLFAISSDSQSAVVVTRVQ